MNYITDHYQALLNWTLFRAPSTPICPALIRPGRELVEIITGGEVEFADENGELRRYGRGAIFWHGAGEHTVYRTPPDNPYRCLVCEFSVREDRRIFARSGNMWSETPKLSSFVRDMMSFKNSVSCDGDAVFLYCIGVLARQMALRNVPELIRLPESLQRICATVEADPGRNYPVAQLAEIGSVSLSRLFVLFREYLAASPHQWMLERKLLMAEELLSDRQDMPIKQVAESCGFDTLEIFYRRFRRHFGMTPGEFRLKKANSVPQKRF